VRAHDSPVQTERSRTKCDCLVRFRRARCAAKAGVRQFIYLLSKHYPGQRCQHRRPAPPFREEDPATPRGVYGLSKAAAEAGLEAVAKETDMSITVIRPPPDLWPRRAWKFQNAG